MFGIEEKVERVRQALIKALKAKNIAITHLRGEKTTEGARG